MTAPFPAYGLLRIELEQIAAEANHLRRSCKNSIVAHGAAARIDGSVARMTELIDQISRDYPVHAPQGD